MGHRSHLACHALLLEQAISPPQCSNGAGCGWTSTPVALPVLAFRYS